MPLPGQSPAGPDGKYSPLQMADWLIDKASDFKSGQDLLDAISGYGLDMTPSDVAPMEDPMMGEEPMMDDPMMDEPMMEEPPMAEDEDKGKDKGKGKKGPAFLEIMRIGAAEKAIDKDKKKKKKAKDEEEGY